MKTLLLLLLLAGMGAAWADDNLLQNGDFADGLAHWYGNVKAPDTDLGPAPEPGAIIALKPHDWVIATQNFTVKPGQYKLNITFTIADDTHFSRQLTDYINVPVLMKFDDEKPLDAEPGQWVVVVTAPKSGAPDPLTWTVTPTSVTGPQSYTFTIDNPSKDERTLMLGFPPGHGTVTLTHVSLVDPNPPPPSP